MGSDWGSKAEFPNEFVIKVLNGKVWPCKYSRKAWNFLACESGDCCFRKVTINCYIFIKVQFTQMYRTFSKCFCKLAAPPILSDVFQKKGVAYIQVFTPFIILCYFWGGPWRRSVGVVPGPVCKQSIVGIHGTGDSVFGSPHNKVDLSVPFYKFRPNSGTSRKINFAHILHKDRS